MQKFVELLSNILPELQLENDERRQAQAEIGTIESQATSPNPNPTIIKASLQTLYSILLGLSSNVLVSASRVDSSTVNDLIQQAQQLLAFFG